MECILTRNGMHIKNNDFPNIAINQKDIKQFYINFKNALKQKKMHP